MTRHKLCNVLLEKSWQFFQAPAMYCAADGPMAPEADGVWRLDGPGTFNFTTFFNALSVEKWQRYSRATTFFLHLEVAGAPCAYVQTRAHRYSWHEERLEHTYREIEPGEDWATLDIPLEIAPDDVLVAFALETTGILRIRKSYYYTELDDAEIRPVELALCTTTFKNEKYITSNVALVKERIVAADEPISKHFHMHVVDNGRTLEPGELEGERVEVHPNPNAGGAGGFARGMLEAMDQTPRATHVLLMDDDVSISPESIIRTYSLLQIVNDEYAEAFLSGAMMNLDEPSLRYEDVGFVAERGKYFPVKDAARVDMLRGCVDTEAFLWHEPDEEGFDVDRMTQSYAAWWYCAIPMSVIDREGLPLPVFVRTDDVEYSLRAHAKMMTMNGICVWHAPFYQRYSAAVERYQMTRNVLIGRFASGMAPLSDFEGDMKISFELELKKYNYTNAELILDALEDFLKGPSFIMEPGAAERSYLAALRKAERLLPYEEVEKQARELGVELSEVPIDHITRDDPGRNDHRTMVDRVVDYVTVNGQRLVPEFYTDKGSVSVIGAAGWFYPVDRLRKKEYLIAIDPYTRKGTVRKIDRERFKVLMERFGRDMDELNANRETLRQEYEAARPIMTSPEFWRHYLGMDAAPEAEAAPEA